MKPKSPVTRWADRRRYGLEVFLERIIRKNDFWFCKFPVSTKWQLTPFTVFPSKSRLTEAGAGNWIAATVAVIADTRVFTALSPTATIAGCKVKQYLH